MNYDFDLFVIGAGSGGVATARRAASYGAKVGVVEFDRLGGTCVNRGCVPKKLMVYASHFPEQFTASQGYGWSPVQSTLNWSKMLTAVNGEVTRLNGIYERMLDNSQVKVFRGYGQFVDPHTIAILDPEDPTVTLQQVTAEKILIAVGGVPVKADIPGIEHAITSDDIFYLAQQPQRLAVIGGGYIGVEFAGVLNGMGSEVTQIVRADKILRGFDEDLRTEIQEGMQKHGIKILNNMQDMAIEKTKDGLQLTVRGDSEETVIVDAVSLAATGREPRLERLGLENTQVNVSNGAITVDAYNETAEPHIFAVGDCTDRINLTPVAINEGRAFADTHFGGKPRKMNYENIPTAVFSTPEAATVGLTEAEAAQKFGEAAIQVYKSRFRPMYYTLPDMDVKTLMKLVVNRNTEKVLGVHMVGDSAAEIIQGMAIAVKMGATKADFDATVGIHPSSAEEFVTMR
ncbi:MAG: glutathione-disulfide reductase [Cyanobacteria bacterium P01_A01_bin.17]